MEIRKYGTKYCVYDDGKLIDMFVCKKEAEKMVKPKSAKKKGVKK